MTRAERFDFNIHACESLGGALKSNASKDLKTLDRKLFIATDEQVGTLPSECEGPLCLLEE